MRLDAYGVDPVAVAEQWLLEHHVPVHVPIPEPTPAAGTSNKDDIPIWDLTSGWDCEKVRLSTKGPFLRSADWFGGFQTKRTFIRFVLLFMIKGASMENLVQQPICHGMPFHCIICHGMWHGFRVLGHTWFGVNLRSGVNVLPSWHEGAWSQSKSECWRERGMVFASGLFTFLSLPGRLHIYIYIYIYTYLCIFILLSNHVNAQNEMGLQSLFSWESI